MPGCKLRRFRQARKAKRCGENGRGQMFQPCKEVWARHESALDHDAPAASHELS